MRKFFQRALKKLSKLDHAQIRSLLADLVAENERMEAVLDSMRDGVVVADVNHLFVMANKAAERYLPQTPGDPGEKLLWDTIADEDIAAFVRRTLERQESVNDREFSIATGGGTRLLAISVGPIVEAGQIRGTMLHIEDISEKRGKEARLRRAESLASLTTLAAGVAHEIKNPLGSIGIHVQLIQRALEKRESVGRADIGEYIDVVNEEVDRLNRIVVDFLFAVRPMNVDLESDYLNEIVRDLLAFVRFELEENNIELVEEYDDELPTLQLDEKYLKQALLNIVKNAISAMPDGGTLRVATAKRGDEAVVRISDNGIGMSEQVMEKIFEPYFTTKDFGSGIGLTLVYKIVKEHMGEISVISQEGKGSTFTISLPIPQKEKHLLGWAGDEAT